MFDFLRNLTKSAEEKRYERITAYLDESLSPSERTRFEAELNEDATLQAELEQERAIKQALNQLPQRRVPRNFTLDPALYGRPAKQPLIQAYPVLRAATGLTAVFLIFALFAGVYTNQAESEQGIAFNLPSLQPNTETVTVEVTRLVTETVAEEGERVEVTRVVTETTIVESAEVEAEPASESESIQDDAAADEALEEEPVAEEEAPAEEAEAEPLEEEMAEEEVMEEEASELLEDPPTNGINNTQEPITAGGTPPVDTSQGESAGEEQPSPQPESTAVAMVTALPTATVESPTATATATKTPLPTATVSQLPRETATATVNRAITPTSAASDELADDGSFTDDSPAVATAVPVPEQDDQAEIDSAAPSTNILPYIMLGLFLLFVVLLATTLYVRRQL